MAIVDWDGFLRQSELLTVAPNTNRSMKGSVFALILRFDSDRQKHMIDPVIQTSLVSTASRATVDIGLDQSRTATDAYIRQIREWSVLNELMIGWIK